MTISWFFSKTVRHLSDMCRQMKRVMNEQRDLLSPEAINGLTIARSEARQAIQRGASKEELKQQMARLEEAARKWCKAYPNPGVRENVKEFLVAVVTILAFTTFFLQLTKIPTGSMQPTLFGIVQTNLQGTDFQVPGFLERFWLYWTKGISYKHLVAPSDGRVDAIFPPKLIIPFVKRQTIIYNGKALNIWFPPEEGVQLYGELQPGQTFRKGEDIVKLRVVAGDHLLVDRFTYNFRHPKRGEIIVFKTRGILGIPNQDQLYIKRLIALPNETVRIGNDNHVYIDGDRLDAGDRHFEMVYTFDPRSTNNAYMGHANGRGRGFLAPIFPNEQAEHKVGPRHYMAMGDNTLNSADSRAWGDLPQENVIGRCWFVYWPFTERFGWGYR